MENIKNKGMKTYQNMRRYYHLNCSPVICNLRFFSVEMEELKKKQFKSTPVSEITCTVKGVHIILSTHC